MHQTNAVVNISSRTRDWKNNETEVLIGSYDVWLDEHSSTVVRSLDGMQSSKLQFEISKGLVIMFTDIDLTDCIVNINGDDYEIVKWDRFYTRKKQYHHTEFIYR